jgi:hypothetical protein
MVFNITFNNISVMHLYMQMLNHYTMPEQKKNRKYLPLVVFSLYKPRKQRNEINILQVSGIVIKRNGK